MKRESLIILGLLSLILTSVFVYFNLVHNAAICDHSLSSYNYYECNFSTLFGILGRSFGTITGGIIVLLLLDIIPWFRERKN